MTGSERRPADSAHTVRRRVEELLPDVLARARAGRRTGPAVRDLVHDLRSAGALGLLQPARHGGLEVSPLEFFRLVREVSAVSLSAGWLTAFLGVNAWHTALFDEQAQQEVWGPAANPLICAAHTPLGRLHQVADGYLLSGRWTRSTAAAGADWAILAAVEVDRDGRPLDCYSALVPRADLRGAAPESVAGPPGTGLPGTGTLHLEADRVPVPPHRLLATYPVSRLRAPGRAANPGALYRLPWGVMYAYAATAPLLGAAEGCYSAVVAEGRESHRLSLGGHSPEAGARLRDALGRAGTEIDAAVLQTERNLEALYAAAQAGRDGSQELRLLTRRDQARAAERAAEAIDRLVASAHDVSVPTGERLERAWREAHVAVRHRANDTHHAFNIFGAAELGIQVEDDLH